MVLVTDPRSHKVTEIDFIMVIFSENKLVGIIQYKLYMGTCIHIHYTYIILSC